MSGYFKYVKINSSMVLCEFTEISDHNPSDICHLSLVICFSSAHGLVNIDTNYFCTVWLCNNSVKTITVQHGLKEATLFVHMARHRLDAYILSLMHNTICPQYLKNVKINSTKMSLKRCLVDFRLYIDNF